MRVIESDAGVSHAVELVAIIEVQRAGLPILVMRDGEDRQRVFVLEPGDERVWVGRDPTCDVRLDWDDKASRSHAELVRVPEGWSVIDDGLSRNGTFVGAERVAGRRRLRDGDVVRFGDSRVTYRIPGPPGALTVTADDPLNTPELTSTQRKVLVALCRTLWNQRAPAVPATNPAIAYELTLSVEAVKSHMRTLFKRCDIEDLPQNQKRARLAERAIQSGVVSQRDV